MICYLCDVIFGSPSIGDPFSQRLALAIKPRHAQSGYRPRRRKHRDAQNCFRNIWKNGFILLSLGKADRRWPEVALTGGGAALTTG
jgi:hypothetical protein